MDRRRFLTHSAALALLGGCHTETRLLRLGVPLIVRTPGMHDGHRLRAQTVFPAPISERHCQVAILGSGIAGLTAAWRLAREGWQDFLLLNGPEPDGNAAAARFSPPLQAPTGAHYLPVPTLESAHVREILHDLGILLDDPSATAPRYDEQALVHAPTERVLHAGLWQDGVIPEAVSMRPQARRLWRFLEDTKAARGADGRRPFTQPLALASPDPRWRSLDTLSFAQWLAQQGYDDPDLLAYLAYACRDDYGANPSQVSAWAGVHYFASRNGQAAHADDGAVLTWPEGNQRLAAGLRQRFSTDHCVDGMAIEVVAHGSGQRVRYLDAAGNCHALNADKVICAMPLHVARHVIHDLGALGYQPEWHQPPSAPWLIGNFVLEGFPQEAEGSPLAWDNVIQGSPALGWVVATHQWFRVARPAATVFTTYRALNDGPPADTRHWLEQASPDALLELALTDLRSAYGDLDLWRHLKRIDLTVRGHGMAIPVPGFLSNPGLAALRQGSNSLLFAHSDLSGLSVFEEASWWGDQAARRILAT